MSCVSSARIGSLPARGDVLAGVLALISRCRPCPPLMQSPGCIHGTPNLATPRPCGRSACPLAGEASVRASPTVFFFLSRFALLHCEGGQPQREAFDKRLAVRLSVIPRDPQARERFCASMAKPVKRNRSEA
jgi:hypothetical protein